MFTEKRIALRNVGKINPDSIEDYIEVGGYKGLDKARNLDPKEVIEMIEHSGGLRGRGGAGFNTGFKWSSAFHVQSEEKYVVCNADEGEPGTYKDRIIMENDPHTLIEGMLIAAYAVGARTCYIYCRGEYKKSIQRLRHACKDLMKRGINQGISLKVISGAGAYVCGEETALINSLESKRGEPRLKPPFPTIAGFMDKPTVVNNVETFASIPMIVEKGGEWFRKIGADKYPGTKILSLSGDIANKNYLEVATNTSLRTIIEEFGGGLKKNRKLKAVQVGGSSCAFLRADQLDTPIDFESMRFIGASLGSGAILVIDDSHNMVEVLSSIAHFFKHESCGKCLPCREGTYRVAEILDQFVLGRGRQKDMKLMEQLADHMSQSCFCALGQSATVALTSAMKLFPDDFKEKQVKQEVEYE